MTTPRLNHAELRRILDNAVAGSRLSETEAAALFRLTGRDIWKVAAAADERREEVVGDTVTYVRNMNLHMTLISPKTHKVAIGNICTTEWISSRKTRN